jgi:hypothetical protein
LPLISCVVLSLLVITRIRNSSNGVGAGPDKSGQAARRATGWEKFASEVSVGGWFWMERRDKAER